MSKTVIIGGVAGGATCAARLRRLDETAEIIVLERGEHISYANCGLPYYAGDVIKSRSALLLQTPEGMKSKYNIDVRVRNEVTAINKEAKTISVRRADTGEVYEESYDNLVISTGSSPVRPPIPGIDSPRIQTVWTVEDSDRIKSLIQDRHIESAAVIGGGFIGLEMAENLRHAGLRVSIVEMLDQVMAPLDIEMAQMLHETIRENGVDLHLGDGVSSFADKGDKVSITLNSGATVTADLVILSIGVKPNGELAKAAGLEINQRGGIVADEYMKTSDPSIYAVGDVIEVNDLVLGGKTMIPLAGPANKQGRIAADNICGLNQTYRGTQGTSVAKVFDLTAASTGVNEKALAKRGLVKGTDYETVTITQNSHAGYYPGAVPMTIKLIFTMDGSKLYGAQIVGTDGVDKRIDTIAVTIRLGGGVEDLTSLELAYAPPYSSAKDPVNMAGFVAENVIRKNVRLSDWNINEKHKEAILLDVREDAELMAYSVPGAVHIPLGQLRSRIGELDKSKEIITFCAIGVRAYNAARTLMQNGCGNVLVYPGGVRLHRAVYAEQNCECECSCGGSDGDGGSGCCGGSDDKTSCCCSGTPKASLSLDCSGLQCPGPIMKVFEAMKDMKDGDVLEVTASDPGFIKDIAAWCKRTGNTLLGNEKRDGVYAATVCKGGTPSPATVTESPQGKTIIVFSGDLDKVLASFIIANGAAAMGRPVTMFFTFWGLTALRKSEKQPVKKTFMESMFGTMLPRGTSELKLSRMNMGGMGTSMMKKIMNDKNVDSLETLIKKAMDQGVKIVACTMSMDVMGIKEEELIDGVELGGVGAYLGDAEESNVNLFI